VKERNRLTLIRLVLLPYKFLVSLGVLIYLIIHVFHFNNVTFLEFVVCFFLTIGATVSTMYHVNISTCSNRYVLNVYDAFGRQSKM